MVAQYTGSPLERRQRIRQRIEELKTAQSNLGEQPAPPAPPPTGNVIGYDVPSDQFGEMIEKEQARQDEEEKKYREASAAYEQDKSMRESLAAELEQLRQELTALEQR